MNESCCDFTVTKCPTNELSLTNCVIVNSLDFTKSRYCQVENGRNQRFVFTAFPSNDIPQSTIGFSMVQRKWAFVSIGQKIKVRKIDKVPNATEANFVVDFLQPGLKKNSIATVDSDVLKEYFDNKAESTIGCALSLTESQPFLRRYQDYHLLITVQRVVVKEGRTFVEPPAGLCSKHTKFIFERSSESPISLTGHYFNKKAQTNIINPDFNFHKLGIGGLDEEFKEIFRRAFASRVLPPHIIEKMGAKHVKGILLHGPPGCGKTLMARQIGKMLSTREPQIVNGPEILNKYVGESEGNIRRLFEPAEEEQKKLGINSGLHIIIFDEIDAICKQRGSIAGASGVHDTVVNQLLSKIDGVEQLNNILVIGMTNRPDLIDDALVRPGRLEVKKEIGLPDEKGRLEILRIHTEKMVNSNMMHSDVKLSEIASLTKNFSGAELAGLVGAAQSCAFVRHTKAGSKVEVEYDTVDSIKVCRKDFMASLENDIKPAYGSKEEDVEKYMRNGIIIWGPEVSKVQNDGGLLVNQVKNNEKTPLVSVIITGAPGSGKTALATRIACDSEFPFVKICSPSDLIGYSEAAKCQHLKKVFDDSYRSQLSVVVVDDIERLMDYNPIGPRFSNSVAQALAVLCRNLPPQGRRLLVIATTSSFDLLKDMGMDKSFDTRINVPCCSEPDHITKVLNELKAFDSKERDYIEKELKHRSAWVGIKPLIRMIGTAEEASPSHRATTFLTLLEEEGNLK